MVVKTNVVPHVSPSQIDTLTVIEASIYQVSTKGFSNMLEYDLRFFIYPSLDKKYALKVSLYEVPYLYKHKKSYKDFIDSNLTPTEIKSCKTLKEVADFINDRLLSRQWSNPDVFKVKLRIIPYLANENEIYEAIYVKKGRFTHSGMMGAVRHDYIQHGKLKSNTMKQNKSPTKKNNNLAKSCKRMTGDIGQLGKNFRKLI